MINCTLPSFLGWDKRRGPVSVHTSHCTHPSHSSKKSRPLWSMMMDDSAPTYKRRKPRSQESNQRPLDPKSDTLLTKPSSPTSRLQTCNLPVISQIIYQLSYRGSPTPTPHTETKKLNQTLKSENEIQQLLYENKVFTNLIGNLSISINSHAWRRSSGDNNCTRKWLLDQMMIIFSILLYRNSKA